MTKPVNAFDTYAAVGNREDLTDIIYNISPTETPFFSMAARTKATARYHEWQTDSLAAAAANTQLEGDEPTPAASTATARLGNHTQIFHKTLSVTGTQDVVDKAGRNSETSYQLAKRGKEMKRDIEYALTRNQASTAGTSATPRSLASIESWLKSTTADANAPYVALGSAANATTPGFSGTTAVAPTDGTTLGAFTETSLKTIVRQAWTNGGEPGVVMVGPWNKQVASGFTGIATQYRQTSGNQRASILGAADVYISDFGEHKIIPNRFSRDRTILVLDMDYWAVAWLRPIKQFELAKTGDLDRRMMVAELTLEARQPLASGKAVDASTS